MTRFIPAALASLLLFVPFAPAADKVDFGRDVLPILSANCFQCHGLDAATRKAKLRLDTLEGAVTAKDAVVVPGKSGASRLMTRVTSGDAANVMPPPESNKKLSPQQIETLRRWIDEGAAWGKHWAYVPPTPPAVPKLRDPKAVAHNPIDLFIQSRLEREGLAPLPEAPRELLLRRVTLDLTGLPPTPAETAAFLADKAAGAYERVVDRLLASPRYGERMAWEWLDAARYADTNGYQGDPERTMWPWRDWVVKALNDNMPYDRFTVEQLAGDLLPSATVDQKVATGFNRNHMHNGEGGRIAEETRVENVMDRVETTGTVWMGLTVGCARCHDHKFDPITQQEYYRLFAYFNNTSENGGGRAGQQAPVIEVAGDADRAKLAELRKRVEGAAASVAAFEAKRFAGLTDKQPPENIASLPKGIQDELRRPAAQRTGVKLKELIAHFQKSEPEYVKALTVLERAVADHDRVNNALPRVMVMDELPKPRDTFILVRGAYNKPADKVGPGTPAALPPLPTGGSNDRLALAKWLTDPAHPLTARVTVNRHWQTFFGTGLVKTAEDFGRQGERPSHPELLDWLATEFVRTGWDVKRMHKLIVTSATYRQSSKVTPTLLERDPDNRLLARGPRYRMPSWMIRDQALAASGLLSPKTGGPSVRPYQPAGVWEEATFGKKVYVQDKGEDLYRRSLYTFWRRIVGPTAFFDAATRQTCSVNVVRTNTPLHALTTLNDTTYVEAARALAQRVLATDGTDEERLAAALRFVIARSPTAAESKILLGSLARMRPLYRADADAARKLLRVGESPRDDKFDPCEHAAWTALCSMILNLDETLTKQ